MEPQNPGPRPPNQPSEPPKTEPSAPWISPRLREKLNETEFDEPQRKPSPLLGIILALVVIGGGLGLFVAIRSSGERARAEAAQKARAAAAESTAAAHADSVNRAMADTSASAATAAATAATAKAGTPAAGTSSRASATGKPAGATATSKPTTAAGSGATAAATKPAAKPKPIAPASGGAGAGAAAAAPKETARGPYGIDAGSYIAEDRAGSEQARLATATGLAGRVVSADDGTFHVVLGSFASRAAAEKASDPLLAKGILSEARIVPIKH